MRTELVTTLKRQATRILAGLDVAGAISGPRVD